jgi:3-oxoacyl-[acyl-carrier-protein] synthase II
MRYGYKGPNHAVVTACATGAHAIADAARMIKCGEAKVMIAGGAEGAVTRLSIAGFNACRALATGFNDDPQKASRPWDKKREGFVIAEGAAVLVLEDYEHAKARGANILAEIVGYGYTGDAYHITAPHESGEGGYRAMEKALKMAGIDASDIDYINAHGTSTGLGDLAELRAVKKLMDGNSNFCMSSSKSATGHLLGAAGSLEALFSVCAIQQNIAPPTLNLDDPEPECEGVNLVPHKAQERSIDTVLSNSFGFGGTNISLVIKRV